MPKAYPNVAKSFPNFPEACLGPRTRPGWGPKPKPREVKGWWERTQRGVPPVPGVLGAEDG